MKGITSMPLVPIRLLSIVAGILLGTCLLLTAKIYNPPVPIVDSTYQDLLGKPIPEVMLQDLDGVPMLPHAFKGNAHLLVFASAGCSACDNMYPLLKEASKKVSILMIADSREDMKKKALEQGFTFTVAYDSTSALKDSLKVRGVPTAMIISPQGIILKAAMGGGVSMENLLESIQGTVATEGGVP